MAMPPINQAQSPIQKFYAGQRVFLTGGTGFLGKALIEKLLRITQVSLIYMLVRQKKGMSAQQRTDKVFDDVVFQQLKILVPNFRDRIVIIPGDVAAPGLGLSEEDKNTLLNDVTVVFHAAASVKFNEELPKAVPINIRGPKEILELCRGMKKIKAVVHVSTAFSNCKEQIICEKFYPPAISGDDLIQLVQTTPSDQVESLTQNLLGDSTNTYVYTKQIAEDVVKQNSQGLPLAMFRPAVVISSYREPIEGWIDNLYGPTGALIGVAMGVIRVLRIDEACTAELVPVDYTVNAMIAIAWDLAQAQSCSLPTDDRDPPVYNYQSTWTNKITWGKYIEYLFEHGTKIPSVKSIWCYSLIAVKSSFLYYLFTILLHFLPGLFFDAGLFLTGRKMQLTKLYKKIFTFSAVTSFFSNNSWKFENDNTRKLWAKLSPSDQSLFYFSMADFDWSDYFKNCVKGVRVYTFKDDMSTLEIARKRMAKILIAHRVIKWSFLAFVGYIIYVFLQNVINVIW